MKAASNLLVVITLFQTIYTSAQVSGPEQDCINALKLCQLVIVQPESYLGYGATEDLQDLSTCLQTKEDNSVWYTFTIRDSGMLKFLIIPIEDDDYDFALYNLTDGFCSDISDSTPGIEARCNYQFSTGPTGLKEDSSWSWGSPFREPLDVYAGETYVLLINKVDVAGSGYTLDFSASSASFIIDSTFCNYTQVEELKNAEIAVFPNPSNFEVIISLREPSLNLQSIKLISITGQEVISIQADFDT